jgi:hypothetical protein
MQTNTRKQRLLELFTNITNKTKIVEPMKKIHGTLRDREAVEREIALLMREILEQGLFKTKLKPIQLAKLVSAYYGGKNDTEIARELGDEKLSKTVARARVRLKLFRDLDFRILYCMSELKSAWEVAQERVNRLGKLSSEEKEQQEKQLLLRQLTRMITWLLSAQEVL